MSSEIVYADYAAASPIAPPVVRAMAPFWLDNFANPSSVHQAGEQANQSLQEARKTVAKFFGCQSEEITFTSGGTEANNLAIIGVARANRTRGRHIITSSIEHPSVLNACRFLEKGGWHVSYIAPDSNGLIKPESVRKALSKETILVSIHMANSEIGVVQDISAISRIIKRRTLLHSDACQATPYLPLNVDKLGVDLLTINGAKAYGPKGVGALYVHNQTEIYPISYGGGQEAGLRSGTENVAAIVGLAAALTIVESSREKDAKNIASLRDRLKTSLRKLRGVKINVAKSPRLPNHLSITLPGMGSENLVEKMSQLGVAVSAGSACGARELIPSHVLTAIGLSPEEVHRSLRITLGRYSTKSQIEKIVRAVQSIVA